MEQLGLWLKLAKNIFFVIPPHSCTQSTVDTERCSKCWPFPSEVGKIFCSINIVYYPWKRCILVHFPYYLRLLRGGAEKLRNFNSPCDVSSTQYTKHQSKTNLTKSAVTGELSKFLRPTMQL